LQVVVVNNLYHSNDLTGVRINKVVLSIISKGGSKSLRMHIIAAKVAFICEDSNRLFLERLLHFAGYTGQLTSVRRVSDILANDEMVPGVHSTDKQQRRKVLTLQNIAPMAEQGLAAGCAANVAGFSLHAVVMSSAQDRGKLERLCRYITRSGVSEKRLAMTTYGNIIYQLKMPYISCRDIILIC
jgi:hypothetical protein